MSEYSQNWQMTVRPAPVQAASTAARPIALGSLIGRIEEAIELETSAIKTDPKFDLKSSIARKSRHLHELNKAVRGLVPGDLRPDDRDGIVRLRGKLASNEAAIRAHLDAVTEIATLVQEAIEHHEADGTYSSSGFGRIR